MFNHSAISPESSSIVQLLSKEGSSGRVDNSVVHEQTLRLSALEALKSINDSFAHSLRSLRLPLFQLPIHRLYGTWTVPAALRLTIRRRVVFFCIKIRHRQTHDLGVPKLLLLLFRAILKYENTCFAQGGRYLGSAFYCGGQEFRSRCHQYCVSQAQKLLLVPPVGAFE